MEHPSVGEKRSRTWATAHATLIVLFLCTAYTTMANISAGLFTSYAADVVVPAMMYISLRSLHRQTPSRWPLARIFGRTPELTALTLFLGSTATEVSQIYWPAGAFAGTFDPWDVAAYFLGVSLPYSFDRRELASINAKFPAAVQ